MKKYHVPVLWTAFAVCGLACAVLVFTAGARKTSSLRSGLTALERKINAVKPKVPKPAQNADVVSEEERLQLARDRAREFRDGLLNADAAAPIITSLRDSGWIVAETSPTQNTEYVAREIVIRRNPCGVEEWPNLRAAVQLLSSSRGVRIQSMSIVANGDEAAPLFTKVELVASLFIRPPAVASAAAN